MHGDIRYIAPTLPSESVHCIVTSPPYWGLRDYGVDGQIGLEATPDEYVSKLVAVFSDLRRALRRDGTLWLMMGDCYAHKSLVGVPWRVAMALQSPYYTGRIKKELDRVWVAAMLDAEGNISISQYETNGREKTNIYITVTNSSIPIIEKCDRLFDQDMKHIYEKANPVNQAVYRWDVERMDVKAHFLREVYPYLVAKKKQAILGYTFLEMQQALYSKQQEKRTWIADAMSFLNSGHDVDLPDWVCEPPTLYEPGYYLRQDIIWAKPNPMPESVRDRCTRSHEYIFLLTKSARYYYDAEAIKEPAIYCDKDNPAAPVYKDARSFDGKHTDKQRGHGRRHAGFNDRWNKMSREQQCSAMRNKRDVWRVATAGYPGAHFATFPPDLIRPCVLAGCPPGGTVLDPFLGSGTTAQVAIETGRQWLGVELNESYIRLAEKRIRNAGGQARMC